MSDEASRPSFETLVEAYHRRIYDLILRNVLDPEVAVDLTQETFLTAYRRYADWEGKESAHMWLCRIAIDCCKSHLRKLRPDQRKGRNLDN